MSSTARQNNLLVSEDWTKIYQSFKNADFQSYDFDNLRRTMIDYIRTNFPEDFNDYIESSEYLALIDLIAYVGQSIAFRVDLNARENFLELAERRDSVLRLAQLVSYNASRNVAASGLLKIQTIRTSENVIDSNGRNIAGQYINWNDPSNPNWYDQFIKVFNAAMPATQQFGTPADHSVIYGIPTAQYRFNSSNTDVPIYTFSQTVAGRAMNFEITSATFKGETFVYEEAPKAGNQIACIYSDDGHGAGSPGTGFFFNFTQGSLNTATFTVTQPSSNQTIDIATQNINNTDVWLYGIDQKGAESTAWTKIPAVTGNNVIYNSLSSNKVKNIYSVLTKANDAIALAFSDGVFGNLPLGSFRVYYRVSNNLSYTINPSDIVNVGITIPYISAQNTSETLSITLSLATSVTNATASETNASIKTNAPQTYYTQNRMITGEDYNISPLSANLQVAKVKAVNRTSSGISRYFDLTDPTGKYSSTNLFADDGVLYQQPFTYSTTFTYTTQTEIAGIIANTVTDILRDQNLRNFYYANFIDVLTVGNSAAWYSITSDSNMSSGYIGSIANATPYTVGQNLTATNLKYVGAGALLKFVAPAGYYFNTKKNNELVAYTGNIPAGGTSYVWAEVVSVSGDGTASGTGRLATGFGPIRLNQQIPTNAVITQILPKFVLTITPSVQSTMIDLIFANQPFGLRYDAVNQAWQIIYEQDLNVAGTFSLVNQGDTSSTQIDSSWMLLFTTNNEYYTITTRQIRYVFESDAAVTFYFDSNQKIYDIASSNIVKDQIKLLSINTQPDSTSAFTVDSDWQVVSEYVGQDGYIDPKKIIVTFADSSGNGVVDNPQLFLDMVNPNTGNFNQDKYKYIIEEKYTITEGQEDYRYVLNDPDTGPVIIKSTQTGITSTLYPDGQYFYFIDAGVVKKLNRTTGIFSPTLDYRVYTGRDKIKFQYTHSADYDSRIDPGPSNIIDIYVLTDSYDSQFRQWLSGANISEPLPPSSAELNSMLSSNLNLIKAISDEIVYHPVSYKLLFGEQADPTLQATFNVIINPTIAVSTADVTARILTAINQFFALQNWDFGDTFYFTELSTYVMNQLAPDITNFVIVPTQSGQYFGSLFEVQCSSNQIFLSCATAKNIVIVSGLTSANLKTVTGEALTTVVSSQNITSANFGASN